MTFREACEYPDGGRVEVGTTLEVRDGKIFRQVDLVARDARANREEESGRGPPDPQVRRAGADATLPDRLLSPQAGNREGGSRMMSSLLSVVRATPASSRSSS